MAARSTVTAFTAATDPRKTGGTGRMAKPRDTFAQPPELRGRTRS